MRHKITPLLGKDADVVSQMLALIRVQGWLADFSRNDEYLTGDVLDIARLLVHIAYTALVKCEYNKVDFAQIVMPLLGKTGLDNPVCNGCKAEEALLRAWKQLENARRDGGKLQRRIDEHFEGDTYIAEAWEDCDDSFLDGDSEWLYDLDKYRVKPHTEASHE